jgi:hypothetical protein
MGLLHYSEEDISRMREYLSRIKKRDPSLTTDDMKKVLGCMYSKDEGKNFELSVAFLLGAVANETSDQEWYKEILGMKKASK